MDHGRLLLALLGDLMLGRGIDQVLRRPSEPVLYEPWLKDAREYVGIPPISWTVGLCRDGASAGKALKRGGADVVEA
jgi:hypothetical protein